MKVQDFNNVCAKLVEAYKAELNSGGKNATGDLNKYVKSFVTFEGGARYILWFSAPKYWRYIEYGRKSGKYVPIQPLVDWLRVKQVVALPRGNNKPPTRTQLAYAISTSIKNKGIRPFPALKNALIRSNAESEMIKIVTEQLNKEITQILNFDILNQ